MQKSDLVRDVIYRATMLLDQQEWEQWLALCSDEFVYEIKSWSPEINYDMTYLQLNRQSLASTIKLLPKHNSEHSPLTRHTTVYSVELSEDCKRARAVSSVVVFQTLLDGIDSHIDSGESRLFLVGKYLDTLNVESETPLFLNREVRLDTRRLDKGTHWPI